MVVVKEKQPLSFRFRGRDGGGVILGAEFLQDTGMHVNSNGEAYCPAQTKKKHR